MSLRISRSSKKPSQPGSRITELTSLLKYSVEATKLAAGENLGTEKPTREPAERRSLEDFSPYEWNVVTEKKRLLSGIFHLSEVTIHNLVASKGSNRGIDLNACISDL